MNELSFKVKEITLADDYGEFAIEPLSPGYGYTIGNALRRVLYSSIEGAAVTSVRISGVKHRFSTVPGLKENVIDLLLHIKELNLALPNGKDSGTLKLSVKSEKEITAGDLESPDGVEVINKDLYLGSLSGSKPKLEMELTVEKGYEYSLSEERKMSTLGVIATDAIYTPVRRVNYTVEATRVGRQTNLDKLVIRIWTNGAVNPKDALEKAARILTDTFAQVVNPKESDSETVESVASSIPDEIRTLTIDELDLPTRIYNSLRNGGIETVGELLETPRKELVSMRNMGGKSLGVIEEKLQEKGITLSA